MRKSLSIRIEEDMLKKLQYVAEYNGRSMNKEILQIIREHIKNYEKEHEKIELN